MRTEPSFSVEPDDQLLDKRAHSQSHFDGEDEYDSESQLLADYRQRYGLSIDPFADDHHFPFYTGAQRRQVLDQLIHLCQFSHNLLVVLGEYGVGKTRIAQALIDALDDADDICFIEGQIDTTYDSLLAATLDQFELSDVDAFDVLADKDANGEGIAVIIVDNAHHIADDALLDFVSLVYAKPGARVHLVLLAEPHLLSRLESMDVADVVLTDLYLNKFSLSESVDYLNFRMEMADYLGPEFFTDAKVDPWWRQSQGQLVHLHEAAQHALLASVTPTKKFAFNKRALPLPHIVGVSVLGGALLMGGIYWSGSSSDVKKLQKTEPVPIVKTADHEKDAAVQVQSQQVLSSAAQTPATSYSSPAADTVVETKTVSSVPVPVPEAVKEPAVIKQSVVPLVQANSVARAATSKPQKSMSASSAKEEKKAADAIQHEAKVITKAELKTTEKNESKAAEKNKSLNEIGSFSDQEKTILSWENSEYTLQLLGVSTEKAAHDFIAAQSNKKDLLMFKSVRQGKDWFVVVTGRFPSSAKARQSIEQLPETQKKASPWPRELRVIQQEIKQR